MPGRTKRKGHTVHIKTEAKKHTYSKGNLLQIDSFTVNWSLKDLFRDLHFVKQVILLIPKCKAMKYRKFLRRSLWFILFSNSSCTVFEFVVTDGDILNFWQFKATNIGFKRKTAPVQSALGTCQVCPSFLEELYSRWNFPYLDLLTCMNTWNRSNNCKRVSLFVLNYKARFCTCKRNDKV